MKKCIIVLSLIFVLLITTLCGCKLEPQEAIKNVVLMNYTIDGITYSPLINSFSFYSQFRDDDVKVNFTDNEFYIDFCGNIYEGTWKEIKESHIYKEYEKSSTLYKMTDKDGNVGVGYSAKWGFDGFSDYLGFTHLNFSAEFEEYDYYVNTNYSLEDELNRECEILNESMNNINNGNYYQKNNCSYYFPSPCYYQTGEIVKKGNKFYFSNNDTETLLNISNGFFYDFDGTTIEYSDSIRQGNCIYKFNNVSSNYFAIFYI